MLIRRFVVQSIVIFAIVAVGVGSLVFFAIGRYLTDYFVAQTTATVYFVGAGRLSKIDWSAPVKEPEELTELVKYLNELSETGPGSPLIPAGVARLNLFNNGSTMIWSTEASLIGKFYENHPNLTAALNGTARSEWGQFARPDQVEVIETYIPFRDRVTNKVVGAVEIYWEAGNLKILMRKAQMAGVTVVVVVFAIMYAFFHRLVDSASSLIDQRSAELVASQESEEKAYLDIIKSLAAAIDAKDPYTMGHSGRVARNSVMLARALHLPKEEQRVVEQGAILHDVGKIGIKDSILNKPDALSPEEWVEMKAHPEIGSLIIASAKSFDPRVLVIIKHHHERYDGQGYPSGLLNADIPLGARIIGLADAYDAMRSDRPYRRARTPQEALGEVDKGSGTQFDPLVVKAFLSVRDTIESLYNLEEGQRRSKG